ncbi:MAG: response regulator [Anaerolineales bacterium]|nr:response regulator [Anaerolineales bacterium]
MIIPSSKTILIVEDEPDTAEMFSEMIRLKGYRVVKSYGGTAAMALLAQERPDALILDLMMPDISGLDVLRFVRQEPRLESLPVIIVSAKSLPSDIKIGLEAGASVYLTKPVTFNDLIKAIEKTLRSTK